MKWFKKKQWYIATLAAQEDSLYLTVSFFPDKGVKLTKAEAEKHIYETLPGGVPFCVFSAKYVKYMMAGLAKYTAATSSPIVSDYSKLVSGLASPKKGKVVN